MSLRKPRSELCVEKLYEGVISDVVAGTRDTLLNAGIDEKVVEEFQRIWLSKVLSSQAVEHKTPSDDEESSTGKREFESEPSSSGNKRVKQSGNRDGANSDLVAGASAPVIRADPNALIPIHITVPRHISDADEIPKTITINIPASCIYSDMLKELLTRPNVQALMTLPAEQAAEQLQEYVVNAAKTDEKPYVIPGYVQSGTSSTSSKSSARNQRSANTLNGINQSDGQNDFSSESSTDESEDGDESGSSDDEYAVSDEAGHDLAHVDWNEEPLNSGDDGSDPEDINEKIFLDITDEVVCNYEKITRSRDKWTFHLREGVMSLSGKDYVFQRAYGESKW